MSESTNLPAWREELIRTHMHLPRYVAKKFNAGMADQVLISCGSYMLWKSAEKWEPNLGKAFWKYALRNMYKAMSQNLRLRKNKGYKSFIGDIPDESRDTVESNDTAKYVRGLVSRLPNRDRIVVELKMEGESFRTMGRKLGCSHETCKNRYDEALEKLRLLTEEDKND